MLEAIDKSKLIRGITLYNPNTAAVGFILRYAMLNLGGDRIHIRREDDSIDASKPWTLGAVGAVWVLERATLELLLDANPIIPIEYSVDWAEE